MSPFLVLAPLRHFGVAPLGSWHTNPSSVLPACSGNRTPPALLLNLLMEEPRLVLASKATETPELQAPSFITGDHSEQVKKPSPHSCNIALIQNIKYFLIRSAEVTCNPPLLSHLNQSLLSLLNEWQPNFHKCPETRTAQWPARELPPLKKDQAVQSKFVYFNH